MRSRWLSRGGTSRALRWTGRRCARRRRRARCRQEAEMDRRLAVVTAFVVAVGLWTIGTARGGPPFTLKVTSAKEQGEGAVAFPDRDDLGTGTFRFNIAPGALAPDRKEAVVLHAFLVDGTPQSF